MEDAEPLRLRIPAANKLDRDSDLLVDQLRSIDNTRLTEGPLHRLDETTLHHIYAAVVEVMGMEKIVSIRAMTETSP